MRYSFHSKPRNPCGTPPFPSRTGVPPVCVSHWPPGLGLLSLQASILPQYTCICQRKLQGMSGPVTPISFSMSSSFYPEPQILGLVFLPAFVNFGKRQLLTACLFLVGLKGLSCSPVPELGELLAALDQIMPTLSCLVFSKELLCVPLVKFR